VPRATHAPRTVAPVGRVVQRIDTVQLDNPPTARTRAKALVAGVRWNDEHDGVSPPRVGETRRVHIAGPFGIFFDSSQAACGVPTQTSRLSKHRFGTNSVPVGHPPYGPVDPVGALPYGPVDPVWVLPYGPVDPVGVLPYGPVDPVGALPYGPVESVGVLPYGPGDPVRVLPYGPVDSARGVWVLTCCVAPLRTQSSFGSCRARQV
jgi:hypothetical protein